jgi:hypothetical protein
VAQGSLAHYQIIHVNRGKENLLMLEKSSWEILEEPNHILIDEDYRPMELLIFLLTWSVEIALAFTVAIVYLRG